MNMDVDQFFKRRNELLFSFSLSDGFRKIFRLCCLLSLDIKLFLVALIFLTITNPFFSLVGAGVIFLFIRVKSLADYFPTSLVGEKILKFLSRIFKDDSAPVGSFERKRRIIKLLPSWGRIFIDILMRSNISSSRFIFLLFRFYMVPLVTVLSIKMPIFYQPLSVLLGGVAMILVFPWINVYLIIIGLKWKSLKRTLMFVVVGGVLLAVGGVILYLMKTYLSKFFEIFAFLYIGIVGILLILFIVRTIRAYVEDKRRLARLKLPTRVEREYLYSILSEFETSFGRRKFVRMIDLSRVEVYGSWPKNIRSSSSNDEAYTYLAQLEEKWLGFDR